MYKFHQTRSKLSQDGQIKRSPLDSRLDSCWNGGSRTPMYLYRWDCMVCLCVCVQSLSPVQLFWPYGLYPAKLLCPWNSPGTNTGVGWIQKWENTEMGVFCIACRFFTTEPPGTWGFHSHQSDADLPWVSMYLSTLAVITIYNYTYTHTYILIWWFCLLH